MSSKNPPIVNNISSLVIDKNTALPVELTLLESKGNESGILVYESDTDAAVIEQIIVQFPKKGCLGKDPIIRITTADNQHVFSDTPLSLNADGSDASRYLDGHVMCFDDVAPNPPIGVLELAFEPLPEESDPYAMVGFPAIYFVVERKCGTKYMIDPGVGVTRGGTGT